MANPSKLPLVSIIIPTRDRVALLRETIVSCLLQEYSNVEIIVVDDGSTTDVMRGIADLPNEFGHGQPMTVIRQESLGGAVARNRGYAAARGDFIQFLDSDDLLHPKKIAIQMPVLIANPHDDFVLCLDQHFRRMPGDQQILWNIPKAFGQEIDRFLADDAVWNTSTPLWRAEFLRQLGGWHEGLHCWQDWEFHLRALAAGARFSQIPTVLQFIRQHEGVRSSNLQASAMRAESILVAGQAVARRLESAGLLTLRRRFLLASHFLGYPSRITGYWDRAFGTACVAAAATVLLSPGLGRLRESGAAARPLMPRRSAGVVTSIGRALGAAARRAPSSRSTPAYAPTPPLDTLRDALERLRASDRDLP